MSTEITRNKLINLTKSLIDDGHTGTIFVRTEDNRSILIGIDAGQIVSLICGSKRGEQAIPMIRDMVKGTYQLHDKVTSYEHLGARPASNESLLLLLADDTAYDQDECDWVHDVLCKALAAYMGPVAPLVCRETISAAGGVDSPDKVRRVVDDLAAEIGNADEAESFRAEVRKEFGRRFA